MAKVAKPNLEPSSFPAHNRSHLAAGDAHLLPLVRQHFEASLLVLISCPVGPSSNPSCFPLLLPCTDTISLSLMSLSATERTSMADAFNLAKPSPWSSSGPTGGGNGTLAPPSSSPWKMPEPELFQDCHDRHVFVGYFRSRERCGRLPPLRAVSVVRESYHYVEHLYVSIRLDPSLPHLSSAWRVSSQTSIRHGCELEFQGRPLLCLSTPVQVAHGSSTVREHLRFPLGRLHARPQGTTRPCPIYAVASIRANQNFVFRVQLTPHPYFIYHRPRVLSRPPSCPGGCGP